jgi:hypothetical protein
MPPVQPTAALTDNSTTKTPGFNDYADYPG